MKYILFILTLIVFTSCKQPVTQLPAKVAASDSMAINWFKGDGTMDTVTGVNIIKDKNSIGTLAKMAGGYVTEKKNCGYDGSLHFFKDNQVIQDVRFRMNDAQCTHFEFVLDGKLYVTELKPEAKTLLESLHR